MSGAAPDPLDLLAQNIAENADDLVIVVGIEFARTLHEVARAAREACDVAPALMSDGPFAQKLNDLFAALARLDGNT